MSKGMNYIKDNIVFSHVYDQSSFREDARFSTRSKSKRRVVRPQRGGRQ